MPDEREQGMIYSCHGYPPLSGGYMKKGIRSRDMSGHIKLERKIIDWEWYKDINTKCLFIHLLLKANWKDGRFCGKVIERGSLVTSLQKLSEETGLTVREVRTALTHLEDTGEIEKSRQANIQ